MPQNQELSLRKDVWSIALGSALCLLIGFLLLYETFLLSHVFKRIAKISRVVQAGIILHQLHVYAVLMTALSAILFLIEPQPAICTLQRFLASFCQVLCHGILLTRLSVCISLKSFQPLNSVFQALFVTLLCLIQTAINVQWVIYEPSTAIRPRSAPAPQPGGSAPLLPSKGTDCTPAMSAWLQNHAFSICVLVMCTVGSFVTFANPYNYRETQAIAVLSGLLVAVSTIWVLIGFLLDTHGSVTVAQGFGLVATAWLTFLVMMVPKGRREMATGVGQGLYPDIEAICRLHYISFEQDAIQLSKAATLNRKSAIPSSRDKHVSSPAKPAGIAATPQSNGEGAPGPPAIAEKPRRSIIKLSLPHMTLDVPSVPKRSTLTVL